MTPARAEQAKRDLTSVARKVYEAVPCEEVWTDNQITAEMRRLGLTPNQSVIRGCLNTLLHVGLVKEPSPRHFQRAAIREPLVYKPEIDMNQNAHKHQPENTTTTHRPGAAPTPTIAANPAAKLSALDRLARLSVILADIAHELEEIAIQVDEDLKAAGRESDDVKELRDLRALLAKFVK
jgi:hypothetical protein